MKASARCQQELPLLDRSQEPDAGVLAHHGEHHPRRRAGLQSVRAVPTAEEHGLEPSSHEAGLEFTLECRLVWVYRFLTYGNL